MNIRQGRARTRRPARQAQPERWELWWAYTLFRDSSDVKLRPVIILESRRDMIPAIEVTSHAPRDWLIWQYPLMDWARAGLRRPSTAVLSAVVTLPKEALGRRIGRLSLGDEMNIECMLEMQLPGEPPAHTSSPGARGPEGAPHCGGSAIKK